MIPAAVALGAVAWTLAEYLIHRFDGHGMNGRTRFSRHHLLHHARVHWFAPWYEKAVAAVVATVVLGAVLVPLAGAVGAALVTGFVGAFLAYEALHTICHRRAPLTRYGRWARRHHFHHHFKDPRTNHGVTSPVWDVVFGTYIPSPVVRVPRKLAPAWMLDDSGELRADWASDYELVGSPARPRLPEGAPAPA